MNLIKQFVSLNRGLCKRLEGAFPSFFIGSRDFSCDLNEKISISIRKFKPRSVLEVGGINRPLLRKGSEYLYVGMDIESHKECFEIYDDFIVRSIEQPVENRFDLIVSTTLLEHVQDNRSSLLNMYNALNDGGHMYHYVPSKSHPYAMALRLVGSKWQKILIKHLRPHAAAVTGYPAYFNLCTVRQMRRQLEAIGFQQIEISPYYKAGDYFGFFVPAYLFVAAFENFTEFLGLSVFASGFIVSAKK